MSLKCFCGKGFEEKYLLRKHIVLGECLETDNKSGLQKSSDCGKDSTTSVHFQKKSPSKPPTGKRNEKATLLTSEGEHLYHCKACDLVFTEPTTLKTHWLTHRTELRNQCLICLKTFRKPSDLKSHFVTHTGEKVHKCTVCDSSFTTKAILRTHMLIHSEVRFQCDVCGRYFSHSTSLKRHVSKTHSDQISIPREVNTSDATPDTLVTNVQETEVYPERELIIEEVPELFSEVEECFQSSQYDEPIQVSNTSEKDSPSHSDQLTTSLRTINQVPVYQCAVCDKTFKTKKLCRGHQVTVHTDRTRKHRCAICGKTYKMGKNLEAHMFSHSDDRPFRCEICGRYFTWGTSFKRHMLVHNDNDVRTHPCDVCGKSFKMRHHLKDHMNVHKDKSSNKRCNETATSAKS